MKWLRFLPLVCSLPALADVGTLDHLGSQTTDRNQWSWAAVSAMSMRAFPEQGQFLHLSQLEVVARRKAGATTLAAAGAPGMPDKISLMRAKCSALEECDEADQPLLFDIDSDMPPLGRALKLDAFEADISLEKRPVIIRWQYVGGKNAAANTRSGTHTLLVTGYDTGTKKLRIFDPLPMASEQYARHVAWIPFSTYLNPANHLGRNVVPLHEFDQFRMRRTGVKPRRMGSYPMVAVPKVQVPDPLTGAFVAVEKLRGPIDLYLKQEQAATGFPRSDGTRRTGNITAGKAIAVVTLAVDQLVGGRKAPPESLLVRRASAYVVPVLEGSEVVDSFQLLPDAGSWRQGGYSSRAIATLLAELSERDKGELRSGEVFYLVSVPEIGAYFIAHGFENDAMLKSLDYEGRGTFELASEVLAAVTQRIQRSARSGTP